MDNPTKEPPTQAPLTACAQCRYYYITWDESFPYGCRALAFKSRTSPAVTVRSASGMDCQFFIPKNKQRRPASDSENNGRV